MARDPAVIQAELDAANKALAKEKAEATAAAGTAAKEAGEVPPAQAKVDALAKELADATKPSAPVPSKDGDKITPGSGVLVSKAGIQMAVVKGGANDGKYTLQVPGAAAKVEPSSAQVLQIVYDAKLDMGRQQNSKLDWYFAKFTGGPGDQTTAPGAGGGGGGTTPPTPTPGKAPITGAAKIIFQDTFKDLSNWTKSFPGNDPKSPWAYAYADRGLNQGRPIDQSFALNIQEYPPAMNKGLEDTVQLQPGGGVKLIAYKNPFGPGPDWKTPPGPIEQGLWLGAWIWTKMQLNPGCEIAITVDLPEFMTGEQWGAWIAWWLINIQNWQETDMSDGMWTCPDHRGRWWMAGGGTGSQLVDGVISAGVHVLSHVWESGRLRFGWDGKVYKDWPGSSPKPMYLGLQNLMGGWDGSNNTPKMKDRTWHTVKDVTVWSLS